MSFETNYCYLEKWISLLKVILFRPKFFDLVDEILFNGFSKPSTQPTGENPTFIYLTYHNSRRVLKKYPLRRESIKTQIIISFNF